MKLAVISDLHGNYYALSAVMEFLRRQQIDGIIGLGDFVTDGPFPQRMMGVLREMQEEFPCYLVRGNREEYLLENLWQPQNWKAGSSTSALLDYTFRNLTEQDLKFFEQLPTDGVLIGKWMKPGNWFPFLCRRKKLHRTPAVNPFSRHFGSATAHLVKSEEISGCIRSSCFLIWKTSMPPSCLAATATSRNRKNTQEKRI